MPYQHTESFTNHYGVDLKSSDLNRPIEYASSVLNAAYRASGSPNKRKGYMGRGASIGGLGQYTYQKKDPVTGADAPELLKVDQNLYTMRAATISVSYAGAALAAIVSLFLDVDTLSYRITIVTDTTTVLDQDLGVGIDEAVPTTMTTLAAWINGVAGFTAVVSGNGSTPAAFLKIFRTWDIVSQGNLTMTARYFMQANSTASNPLANFYAQRNSMNFENASFVQVQNIVFIATGYDEMMKYDGQTFYRAGLPTPATSFTAALVGAGAITGNNYLHRIQYVQYDAGGNIVESNLRSSAAGAQNAAAQNFSLTVPNIVAGTGFNTNGALVNGNQVGVNTINTNSHTMKVGDTAYFLDGATALYVRRTVTAITGTSITVSGAAVNVLNGAAISNNLTVLVWRNKTSATTPTTWYLVAEIPNNSFAATQTYVDSKTDAQLGEQLITPATDRSVPPKGKYVSQWNGILMVAGKIDDRTSLFFSDIDGPEYFPADSNILTIESGAQDAIAGIAPNNEVFAVLGDNSFTVISGDITTAQIRVETKSRDTGCVAHATIQELDGVLMWLSSKGPRYSSGGQIPQPIGPSAIQNTASRIDPEFDFSGLSDEEKFQLKRALAFDDTENISYLLYCPAESTNGGQRHPNSNSKVYCYDKARDAWLIWNNLNFAGGVSRYGEELYFSERRYSTFTSTVQSILYSRLNLDDAYDYADNVAAIDWDYSSAWYNFGNPSVLKKFEKLKTFTLEEMASNDFTFRVRQEVNYIKDVTKAEFSMAVSGGGYGVSPYGDAAYGDPAEGTDEHPLARDRIKSTRFRFQNDTLHENPILSGWQIQSTLPYKPKFTP